MYHPASGGGTPDPVTFGEGPDGAGAAEAARAVEASQKPQQSSDPANPKDVLGLKKTPLRLFPPVALVYGAEVMRLGAAKYGLYNWRDHPVRLSVYLEAAMRHILQAAEGEDDDLESGLPHAAHAMCCMAIILDAHWQGKLIDDRPKATCELSPLMGKLEAERG